MVLLKKHLLLEQLLKKINVLLNISKSFSRLHINWIQLSYQNILFFRHFRLLSPLFYNCSFGCQVLPYYILIQCLIRPTQHSWLQCLSIADLLHTILYCADCTLHHFSQIESSCRGVRYRNRIFLLVQYIFWVYFLNACIKNKWLLKKIGKWTGSCRKDKTQI